MNATLLLGFSSIGGLLAGYFTARLAPLWVFLGLLAVCLIGGGAYYVAAPQVDGVDGFAVALITIIGVAPFTICAAVAGAIALIARRIANRVARP